MRLLKILHLTLRSNLRFFKLKALFNGYVNKFQMTKIASKVRNIDFFQGILNIHIKSIIDIRKIEISDDTLSNLEFLNKKYLEHRFDLLGSGWIRVDYKTEALGILGVKYNDRILKDTNIESIFKTILSKRRRIKAENFYDLFSINYNFIDWNKDARCGYCWDPKLRTFQQFNPTNFNKSALGADPKYPWELSRFYHLVQMAILARFRPNYNAVFIQEFRNQVLDFYFSNPKGHGINWSSAMECSIRISNILFSYDIFKQLDISNILDDKFTSILRKLINDHYKYILNNLEWSHKNNYNANHYLSNLVGIIIILSYNTENSKKNKLYNSLVNELFLEIKRQYNEDGSNFEGSTSYHRLSSEMIIYAISIVKNRKYNIPIDVLNIIHKACNFTVFIRKSNFEVIQIGDNDSGRFIKLTPTGKYVSVDEYIVDNLSTPNYPLCYDDKVIWVENDLIHDPFISSANSLLNFELCSESKDNYNLEYSFIKSIIGDQVQETFNSQIHNRVIFRDNKKPITGNFMKKMTIKFPSNTLDFSVAGVFDDFGIILVKSEQCLVCINYGRQKNKEVKSHIHSDLLSFELNFNNKNIFVDPGTFSYTGFQDWRRFFRSSSAHNGPTYPIMVDSSQSIFDLNLNYETEVLQLTNERIVIQLSVSEHTHFREFVFSNDSIEVNDYGSDEFTVNYYNEYTSNGYGKLFRSKLDLDPNIDIKIEEVR